MKAAGYVPVRNDAANDGLWVIAGRRQTVYAEADARKTGRARCSEGADPGEKGALAMRWGNQ